MAMSERGNSNATTSFETTSVNNKKKIAGRFTCWNVFDKDSDAARDPGEVEPDFYAAKVGAFGADGGGDAGSEVAGWADVLGELRVDLAELGDFV